MTPTRMDLTTSCMPGGGNAVDISLALMDGGDGSVGPRAEFSTNTASNSYHFIGPAPLTRSQEFLDFKAQAEKLILVASKLCSEERHRAIAIWYDLGKKLHQPMQRPIPAPTTSTNSADKGGSAKPNSPTNKHSNTSPAPGKLSLPTSLSSGHRSPEHIGKEVRRNLEADLGPGEELLLQTTATVPIAPVADSSERTASTNVELLPNGPIKIMDENPPGEIILSSSSSTSESEMSMFDDPSSTWKCKHCPAVFRDWITFQNHKPSHKKIYKCDQCGIVCTTRGNLNVHRRTHSGEKPFICSKCAARFNNSGNLRRHMLTHQGLKPYNCSVCNSKFTEKKSLLIHQRSRHTGERPYVCPDCGQGFSQTSILNTHRLIHSNEKPFCCLKCGHKFRQKSQLTLHEKRHAGVKNHSCSHPGCTAAFVTKADLDRHTRSHAGEKIPCEICKSTFMRKHTLKIHMKSQHV